MMVANEMVVKISEPIIKVVRFFISTPLLLKCNVFVAVRSQCFLTLLSNNEEIFLICVL